MKGGVTMTDIANKMLEYRAKHNLSQAKFGELCGITTQTVNAIENGLQSPSKLTETKIKLVIEKE